MRKRRSWGVLLEDMQKESHPAAGGRIKIKAKGKRRTTSKVTGNSTER